MADCCGSEEAASTPLTAPDVSVPPEEQARLTPLVEHLFARLVG